jgi:hypothetical protein
MAPIPAPQPLLLGDRHDQMIDRVLATAHAAVTRQLELAEG